MFKTVLIGAALAIVSGSPLATAQVVQSYSYDANGRLIRATTTTGGTGTQTTYGLDDADNRVSRTITQGSFAGLQIQSPAPGCAPGASISCDEDTKQAEIEPGRQPSSGSRTETEALSTPTVTITSEDAR